MKDSEKTVVQAKKYVGSVSNKAIQEVVAAKNHYKCEYSMVVTTGHFTKSAIQLALSNDVELWDDTKLNKIINKINEKKSTTLNNIQNIKLEKNIFPCFCQYCNSLIKLNVNELPPKGNELKIKCPECDIDSMLKIDENHYQCIGCNKSFNTFENTRKHEKSCKTIKEKTFDCNLCKKGIVLDDTEFKELKNKHKLKVSCPNCNKETTINKSND